VPFVDLGLQMFYLPKASVRRLLRLGATGDQLRVRLGDRERRSGFDDLSEHWKRRKPLAELCIKSSTVTAKPVSGASVANGKLKDRRDSG
jgi:hypothetical protein